MTILQEFSSSPSLTVPIFICGNRLPKTKIVQISLLCNNNNNLVVVGTSDGQILQFNIDANFESIHLQMIIIAHSKAISCISPDSSGDTPNYVTCSEDGKICLCGSHDARPPCDGVIINSNQANFVYRKIYPHRLALSKTDYLFCIGDYVDVQILDPSDLCILSTTSSRVDPNWITSLVFTRNVLIGSSLSGTLKFWPLSSFNANGTQLNFYEEKSTTISAFNIRSLSYSEINPNVLLLITSNTWQIIDSVSANQLILSECVIEPVEGIVIDVDRIAVGFADQTIVLFQLPISKLPKHTLSEKIVTTKSNIANTEQPFVFALLKGSSTILNQPVFEAVKFDFISLYSKSNMDVRNVSYRIDSLGNLIIWKVPKNLDILVNEFIRNRKPVVYDPTIKYSFGDIWKSSQATFFEEKGICITAIAYVWLQNLIFLGLEDGSVMVVDASYFLLSNFSDDLAEFKGRERIHLINKVHNGSVNCFLYPFQKNCRYESNVLVSGGMDFVVSVIDTVTFECIHRFRFHSGPVLNISISPPTSNARILQTVCSVAQDNSVCLCNIKDNKCIMLANRQHSPVIDVKWRSLDDLLILVCEDGSIYVWQIDTSTLDRVVTGQAAIDVLEGCAEQEKLAQDFVDEGLRSSTAAQFIRFADHKNIAAVKILEICCPSSNNFGDALIEHTTDEKTSKIVPQVGNGHHDIRHQFDECKFLTSPMNVIQLKSISDHSFLFLFDIEAIIRGLVFYDQRLSQPEYTGLLMSQNEPYDTGGKSFSNFITKNANFDNHSENESKDFLSSTEEINSELPYSGSFNFLEVSRVLISLLYGWNMDKHLDDMCSNVLNLFRPKISPCFGVVSKRDCVSLYTPFFQRNNVAKDVLYSNFSFDVRWQENCYLNTFHLLSVISLSNTLMSLKSFLLQLSSTSFFTDKKAALKRTSHKTCSNHVTLNDNANEIQCHQVKQAWSSIAALHCVILPDLIKPRTYASPKIDVLARRWHDNCIEVRDASQALLIRELGRANEEYRSKVIVSWSKFLPTQMDPDISIFGNLCQYSTSNEANQGAHEYSNQKEPILPSRPPPPGNISGNTLLISSSDVTPPIPPRLHTASPALPSCVSISNSMNGIASTIDSNADIKERCNEIENLLIDESTNLFKTLYEMSSVRGISQVRKNQATAIILLGVMGAEFPNVMLPHLDICRATALCLLQLLTYSDYSSLNSNLQCAAIDLFGRGFAVWQPHIDFTKALLRLLELASNYESANLTRYEQPSAEHEISRVAKYTLSLIASVRPDALVNALTMEVARFNAAFQHQTSTHNPGINSSLMKSRFEVLRLLELIIEKHNALATQSITQIGEILMHCLDMSLLKQRSLAGVFPPISKFYMVTYCPISKRAAFGGQNGSIVIHESRAVKSQTIQAHKSPITALAFSQDGKYLASYCSKDSTLTFWQTQQAFLGMGQNQFRFAKSLPAPSEFPIVSQNGSVQEFRARLVWINAKSLTLMLPNGKENRFTL